VAVKRNLTIQLDDDLIRRAKVIAAERGTSVSGLVAQQITELIAARDRYVRARESALQMMSEATDRGGRRWTREELYEERISRYGA
jgi:predicted transcriptional regulator